MTLQEEIAKLKEIKEVCLNHISIFVKQIPQDETSKVLNPTIAAQLYEFAERAISNIPKKEPVPKFKNYGRE